MRFTATLRLFCVVWLSVSPYLANGLLPKRARVVRNNLKGRSLLSRKTGYVRTATRNSRTNLQSSTTTTQRPPQDQALHRPSNKIVGEAVPTTLPEAFRVFFLGEHRGPLIASLILLVLASWRGAMVPLSAVDAAAFGTATVFWWFQEHALHGHLLHSDKEWMGKDIHESHHAKPYHHVSIDPAGLMLGWLLTVHVILRVALPLPIALSATVGYAAAGLFYEWAHFIVHTRVRFPKHSYWAKMKDHHARHHLVDDRYWLGFSIPAIDDLFGTNPVVQDVRRRNKHEELSGL